MHLSPDYNDYASPRWMSFQVWWGGGVRGKELKRVYLVKRCDLWQQILVEFPSLFNALFQMCDGKL